MKRDLLWNSTKEVFWLSFIAFLPLLISLIYQFLKLQTFNLAISKVIHPSEILAFCLSFLAPSIIFLKKSHGKAYKLPFLDLFFYSTFGMYILAFLFVFIIKNDVDKQVIDNLDSYIVYALLFLLITIVYRIYSTYHQSNSSDFVKDKKNEEEEFNQTFKKMINGN